MGQANQQPRLHEDFLKVGGDQKGVSHQPYLCVESSEIFRQQNLKLLCPVSLRAIERKRVLHLMMANVCECFALEGRWSSCGEKKI